MEARYIGKLGFELVARYGRDRRGDDIVRVRHVAGRSSTQRGFKLRLSELERGAVNVVVQPGQWDLPRVDHVGLALDEDEFADTIDRASERELRIQEHGGRRTFVATGAGYRLELHPPREWIEELLEARASCGSPSCSSRRTTRARRRRRSPTCSGSDRPQRRADRRARSSASCRAARRAGRSCTPSCSRSRRSPAAAVGSRPSRRCPTACAVRLAAPCAGRVVARS